MGRQISGPRSRISSARAAHAVAAGACTVASAASASGARPRRTRPISTRSLGRDWLRLDVCPCWLQGGRAAHSGATDHASRFEAPPADGDRLAIFKTASHDVRRLATRWRATIRSSASGTRLDCQPGAPVLCSSSSDTRRATRGQVPTDQGPANSSGPFVFYRVAWIWPLPDTDYRTTIPGVQDMPATGTVKFMRRCLADSFLRPAS
jgi:hypothetical protein